MGAAEGGKSNAGRGNAMQTASGRAYWPADPRGEDIYWPDVPVHLSRLCRFNGALKPSMPGIYTVAQHSVLAHDYAPTEHKLEALMHDAHEAFVQDLVQPLKRMCEDYRDIERLNEIVLRKKLGLPSKITPAVKEIDLRLLATEKRDLMAPAAADLVWAELPVPFPSSIVPWVPQVARRAMVERMKGYGLL